MPYKDSRKRSLTATLAIVNTPRLDELAAIVRMIVNPVSFCIAHLSLLVLLYAHLSGTELLIETVQGGSRVHHEVVG